MYLREALYVIKNELINYVPNVRVIKYSGVFKPESMTVTELQDFAQNGAKPESIMFSACANGNASILITGGKT